MTQQPKDRCANCAYLRKFSYCTRYNIPMLGVNVALTTCECFTPSDEFSDVEALEQTKNHSREG